MSKPLRCRIGFHRWTAESGGKYRTCCDKVEIVYEPTGPQPLRCRIGFHDWTAWAYGYARLYERQLDAIAVTLYQARRCPTCGQGEKEGVAGKVYSLDAALDHDAIDHGERRHLGEYPLPDLVVEEIDNNTSVGLLCRVGLHRESRPRTPLATAFGVTICIACWRAARLH